MRKRAKVARRRRRMGMVGPPHHGGGGDWVRVPITGEDILRLGLVWVVGVGWGRDGVGRGGWRGIGE